MDIRELQIRYSKLPQAKALLNLLGNDSRQTVQLQGLTGSAAPLFFSGVASLMEVSRNQRAMVFILNDADEAGYFYHDLTQVMGSRRVLFFPSGYRRAAKYGQRDAANEILRTEVITSLSAAEPVFVVTSPEAVAEKVVSKKNIDERRLTIAQGESHNLIALEHTLVDYGFQQTDYVYEPGQFALRGSLLDVYSFSSEQPFRIDFFGDDVETIRTFEVETQLSVDKLQSVTIVPELSQLADEKVSLFELLPADSVLVARDWVFVRDRVAQIYDDGFSRQAVTERTEGHVKVTFHGLNELDCYRDSVVHAVNGDKWIGLEEPSLFADWVGDCAVLVGPMLYNNDEEYNYVMDSDIVKGVKEALAEENIHILDTHYSFGYRSVVTNLDITKPEDLKGVKLRSTTASLFIKTIECLGATPVPMSFTECLSSISSGLVDGFEGSTSTLAGAGAPYELVKKVALTNHFIATRWLFMAEDVYQDMPEKWRNILDECALECGLWEQTSMAGSSKSTAPIPICTSSLLTSSTTSVPARPLKLSGNRITNTVIGLPVFNGQSMSGIMT